MTTSAPTLPLIPPPAGMRAMALRLKLKSGSASKGLNLTVALTPVSTPGPT
ncbi:hypothetical protein PS685_05349 [Pseudomonas fluorescens]|uniref:Uncharacterized protein n=1 Tax=Pseudomonas fluorescens TaxID=294 RepID=A0A5E7AMN2_PSEFL|nr:hypothetical protein PS685_05349 [Pseudomonas fluorescens]